MHEKIISLSSELGSTPDGSCWCLKALHPSDPSVAVRGIPDRSAVPSAFLNYQSLSRISPAATSDPTWNFVMQAIPHPANFGWWAQTDAAGEGLGTFHSMLNSQLNGTTLLEKSGAWLGKVERWRLAYAGVTIHYDGPALSNQGTIVCSQVPYAPRRRNISFKASTGTTVALADVCFPDGTTSASSGWQRGSDFPSFDSSQSMPNCYMGEAKEGLYVPLKLTKTCQQWHGLNDCVSWSKDTSVRNSTAASAAGADLPVAATTMDYPFPGLPAVYAAPAGDSSQTCAIPCLGNDVVANICGKNLSTAAGLVVEFRYGFEVQCEPGTELSPFLRVSPQYDSQALKEYFAIARELKDAYPSDYNDLGKLWDVIKGAARAVGPALSFIPKFGPALGMLASAVGGSPPAAALDREREYIRKEISQPRMAKTKARGPGTPSKPVQRKKAKAGKR